MKKGVIVILAVALLGLAAFYAKNNRQAEAGLTTNSNSSNSSSTASSSNYKDGTYNGNSAETLYGPVKIAVTVSSGKISDVKFLEMPNHEDRSVQITDNSKPLLKETTLQKQSSDIDFVSGATSTSYGYQESLQYALDQAKT